MLYQDLGVGQMLLYFDQSMIFTTELKDILDFKILKADGTNIVTSYSLTSLGSNSTAFNRYVVSFYCSEDYTNGVSVRKVEYSYS
jgi:hypothetical protein